jgi:hypothetical protein
MFRACCGTTQTGLSAKPFSSGREIVLKQPRAMVGDDQQWSSIMWALISILYREYCRARLAEMRRFELTH